ncbi:hypothetical protein U9M48_015884 [Paspalum notatum var. saurae]|uniref:Uncharacterized protein n=1 Tax=Paspalum notatum var. saurae TaxID=547442 RepID=A0AAQ3T5Y7_PASNO
MAARRPAPPSALSATAPASCRPATLTQRPPRAASLFSKNSETKSNPKHYLKMQGSGMDVNE